MPSLPNAPEKLVDPVWEQQPNESKTHYIWFMAYAALPPSERTYQKAWNIVHEGSTRQNTRHSGYFQAVARTWRWIERATSKDLFDAQAMQSKWIERDKQRREKAYQVGEKLVNQAERVLNKIEQTPDHDLKASLSEAKDVAVAGTQLQEAAIPSIQLAVNQMQWVLSQVSEEKRIAIMNRLRNAQNSPAGLLAAPEVIDAEYTDVTEYADEETAEE